ncbi:uncharacterized protein EV420DRAFT_1620021 [Desarmillaria tabescens]|uniref:Uncharacterized protein n=1 Tax=Armillaria tabescens TaxID=1929756 RepID=A0AA39KIW3_ARMTA|nr:uncharacterized protein EV420DRAFT_1620021 [Desarmillaria tabescens]KAK0460138.1 hypothetical protein EV420DRAFT_1620021 [Desarmillaria tabescens]
MTWPEKVLRQFAVIYPNPPIENEYHGAYNKLLNTLFPPDTDFTVVPQYLELNSPKGADFIFMFEILFYNKPVFVVELKQPTHLLYDSTRQAADDQCPIPTLHGVSAMGTRLCFYSLDLTQADPKILPPIIPRDPSFFNDTAPAGRWDCSVLEVEGETKLRAVVDEIKQACALVET